MSNVRHPGCLYSFADTIPELERFLGTEAAAQSTWAEAGAQLPPTDAAVEVTLMEVEVATMLVRQGRSKIERLLPKRVRVLRLVGPGFVWLVLEDGYEGAWWEVADRRLKVSAGVGAFVLEVDAQLPEPPYEYELECVQPDGQTLAVVPHQHQRPLVPGAGLRRDDGPWIVDEIDGEQSPKRVRCRRPS